MSGQKTIAGIYIPGLGDSAARGQDNAVKDWRKHGIELEYHPVGWGDGEPFAPKLKKLTQRIDELHKKSGKVTLIGSSAGASGVLNAAATRPDKVSSVISICGKILNSDLTHPAFLENPAFADSVKMLPNGLKELHKAKVPILSVNSLYDGRVPKRDTVIEGAKIITMPVIGHVPTIAYSISVGKKRIAQFIRSAH